MQYRSAEDRLNPIAPADADETTLGGYQAIHGRAVAFDGPDGRPYTVALETDRPDEPGAPWAGYLVFVRWAETGSAILGHVETGDLVSGASEAEALAALAALPLARVKSILDETVRRRESPEPA